MSSDQTPKTRTITLSGRRPVKIIEAEWPIIARASWENHDNEYLSQANRWWSASLRVRRHVDGRTIVYGTASYDSQWRGESGYDYRAGVLVEAGGDLPAAIREVGDDLLARGAHESMRDLIHECTADLPAETI